MVRRAAVLLAATLVVVAGSQLLPDARAHAQPAAARAHAERWSHRRAFGHEQVTGPQRPSWPRPGDRRAPGSPHPTQAVRRSGAPGGHAAPERHRRWHPRFRAHVTSHRRHPARQGPRRHHPARRLVDHRWSLRHRVGAHHPATRAATHRHARPARAAGHHDLGHAARHPLRRAHRARAVVAHRTQARRRPASPRPAAALTAAGGHRPLDGRWPQSSPGAQPGAGWHAGWPHQPRWRHAGWRHDGRHHAGWQPNAGAQPPAAASDGSRAHQPPTSWVGWQARSGDRHIVWPPAGAGRAPAWGPWASAGGADCSRAGRAGEDRGACGHGDGAVPPATRIVSRTIPATVASLFPAGSQDRRVHVTPHGHALPADAATPGSRPAGSHPATVRVLRVHVTSHGRAGSAGPHPARVHLHRVPLRGRAAGTAQHAGSAHRAGHAHRAAAHRTAGAGRTQPAAPGVGSATVSRTTRATALPRTAHLRATSRTRHTHAGGATRHHRAARKGSASPKARLLPLPAEAAPLPPVIPLPPFFPRAAVRHVIHDDLPWAAVVLLALFFIVQAIVDRRDPRLALARRRRDEDEAELP